jgi:hypothetical protein
MTVVIIIFYESIRKIIIKVQKFQTENVSRRWNWFPQISRFLVEYRIFKKKKNKKSLPRDQYIRGSEFELWYSYLFFWQRYSYLFTVKNKRIKFRYISLDIFRIIFNILTTRLLYIKNTKTSFLFVSWKK